MKNFFGAVSLLLAVALFFSACARPEDEVYLDAKGTAQGLWYETIWKLDNGEEVFMEMLIDVNSYDILGLFADGNKIELPERYAIANYWGPYAISDALTFFNKCVEAGLDCVRLDVWVESAQSSLFGEPTLCTSVIYGYADENGDCLWNELKDQPVEFPNEIDNE